MSSLKNLSDTELSSRKASLESNLFSCSMAGVEIPPEQKSALEELQTEFARRGLISVSRRGWANFIGRVVNDYQIESFCREDRYSYTFNAKSVNTGATVLLTLAQDVVIGSFVAIESQLQTQLAFEFTSKEKTQTDAIELQPRQVIENQIYRTNSYRNEFTLPLIASGNYDNLPFYVVKNMSLTTLRTQFQGSKSAGSLLARVSEILARIERDSSNWYHGNLSPDSICFSGDSVLLRDPGYFGQVNERRAAAKHILQTTLLYYPDVDSTDLQALGIIFAESLLKVNPISSIFEIPYQADFLSKSDETDPEEIDAVLQTVRVANLKGHWRGALTLALDLCDVSLEQKAVCAGLLGIRELKKSQLRNIRSITTNDEAIRAFDEIS